jgi:hypothetical protein
MDYPADHAAIVDPPWPTPFPAWQKASDRGPLQIIEPK